MSVRSLLKVFYLVGNIYYNRFKNRLTNSVEWVERLYSFVCSRRLTLFPLPECVIRQILNKIGVRGFSDNCFIVRGTGESIEWSDVVFRSRDKSCSRNVQTVSCKWVPVGFVLCSDSLLFNVKQSLSTVPSDVLFCETFFRPLKSLVPSKAKSIKLSPIECSEDFDAIALEKAVENFVKRRQHCYKNDVLVINLSTYSPFDIDKNLYMRVEDVTLHDESVHINGFMVSEETSVYQSSHVQSFVPSSNYRSSDIFKSFSVKTVVPLGLQNHYRILSKWFRPFFRNSSKELKPVFVVSGASGVGKKLLLQVTAVKLGVHYVKVDCNDLVSATSAQIQANFRSAFNKIKKSSPAVVQLSNIELLYHESDSNDTYQMISCLSDHVNSLDRQYPCVIVITCSDFASLPERLTSLVIAHHYIGPPTESERAHMLTWLAALFSVELDKQVLDHLVVETASFVLADLRRLLALADLQRYKCNHLQLEIKHFSSAFEGLCRVERAKVGDISWQDVGGVDDIKKAVLSSIETGSRLGGLRRTGLLLHGPPGTGKTLLARAVANQVSSAFIPVKGPELLDMYIGQSEANVRQVFSRARDAAPCILFFDELDSLAPSRGNQSSGGVMDRVVSQLLSEMDNLEAGDDVFVLAATNRPDLVDPALLRPGRFDKMIYVGPYTDSSAKLKVLKAISRKFVLEEDFDYDRIVELLPKEITGAQLSALCYNAWMDSAKQIINNCTDVQDETVVVGMQNFETALQSTNINF